MKYTKSIVLFAFSASLTTGLAPAANIASLAAVRLAKANGPKDLSQLSSDALSEASAEDKGKDRKYKLVSIDIPGSPSVQPWGINTHRIVSGEYYDSTGNLRSFIWFNGQVQTIANPEATITAVIDINDNGLLFGDWGTNDVQHAGYYNLATNTWTALPDIPGYPLNIGTRMNNSGQAVGSACPGTFDNVYNTVGCVGWTWDGQNYTIYNYPGALDTYPNAINNKGKEVGLWTKAANTYLGYTRKQGVIEDLTLFAFKQKFYPTAYDINDNGDILAAAPLDPTGYWPTIILHNQHSYSSLPNFPNVLRTFYQGMNEREDLVGIWFNDPSASVIRGFVALREKDGECNSFADGPDD